MNDLVVRAIALYVPVFATAGLIVWRKPNRRWAAGALLATLWNLAGLAVLNSLAMHLGWWTINAPGPQFFGLGVDLWLGWGLLWGAIPALAFRRSIWIAAIAVAWVDLAAMPLAHPVVELGGSWIVGEAVGLFLCVIPGLVLARLTMQDRRLVLRTAMQAALFSGVTFGLVPTAVLRWSGSSWQALFDWPRYWLGIAIQILAVPLVIAASAVQEFVGRGQGTPLPYDPPKRVVTTGPYAYTANPMQSGMTLGLLILGVMLPSPWLVAAAFITFVFSAGIASWHERSQLKERFGSNWIDYDSEVRSWIPRWRPIYVNHSQDDPVACLYFAESCGLCSSVAKWLSKRHPASLRLLPAEMLSPPPNRLTYLPVDRNKPETGLAAFARALEHIHLGWAVVGWGLRLPVINHMLQLLVDALGGGPREIKPQESTVSSSTSSK